MAISSLGCVCCTGNKHSVFGLPSIHRVALHISRSSLSNFPFLWIRWCPIYPHLFCHDRFTYGAIKLASLVSRLCRYACKHLLTSVVLTTLRFLRLHAVRASYRESCRHRLFIVGRPRPLSGSAARPSCPRSFGFFVFVTNPFLNSLRVQQK